MSMNENGFPEPGSSRKNKGSRMSLHPIHEAAMRIADLGRGFPRSRTRDLVGLLLSHGDIGNGARAWRSSQPRVKIHLYIGSERGSAPVYLRIE